MSDLIAECLRLRDASAWDELRERATLLGDLAAAAGRLDAHLVALQLIAMAYRRLGHLTAAIAAYEDVLAAAPEGERRVRAVTSDNLGNALKDAGRLDEALRRYEEALEYEDDPDGRATILSNRAGAFAELGELRSAAAQHLALADELERTSAPREQVAIQLDNAASAVAALGEEEEAVRLLEHAESVLGPDASIEARALNAISRADALLNVGDTDAAARAFADAHDLAFEWARAQVAPRHYREGFAAAHAAGIGRHPDARRLFAEGLAAKDAADYAGALGRWQRAAALSREIGDDAFALRVSANAGALLSDVGDADQAAPILRDVAHEASTRGLAQPEAMAWGTLAALAGGGADVRLPVGALGALARAAVLDEVNEAVVSALRLDPGESQWEAFDSGGTENNLGWQAVRRHAFALAAAHFRRAVDRARELDAPRLLANRLGNLVDALDRAGADDAAADAAAADLEALLARPDLSLRGRIAAHKVVGEHRARRDPAGAIEQLQRACDCVEELRQRVPPGTARTDAMRDFHYAFRLLSRLLRDQGDAAGAFDAFQGINGRRLVDALAAKAGGGASDAPATAAEVTAALRDTGTVLVDLVDDDDCLAAHIVSATGIASITMPGDRRAAADVERGDVNERQQRLVELCFNDPLLTRLAAEIDAAVPPEASLLLVPDGFMHNLPLHVIPVASTPWYEHRPIGHLAAAGALRFERMRRARVGRSLVAGDSSATMPLPHAAEEAEEVAALLGTEALVGPGECTAAAIADALRAGDHDVVHLAVHGRGDPRHGGRASLLLGENEWVAFEELATLPWRAELVVFSGCSTAVSGPRHQRDFLGIAQAAAEAGAATVVACLWPVGDEAAKQFMLAFYAWYVPRRAYGAVDLRDGLDVGRAELKRWLATTTATPEARPRNGREVPPEVEVPRVSAAPVDAAVADAIQWSPFILLGDPIVGD